MNKPTREQIEHRAIELMLEETKPDCTFCDYNEDQNNCAKYLCKSCLMKTALRKAEEELTPKLFENKKDRDIFYNKLANMTVYLGHTYKFFKKSTKPVRHMRFYESPIKYDSVSEHWDCVKLLKEDKMYSIEELLK